MHDQIQHEGTVMTFTSKIGIRGLYALLCVLMVSTTGCALSTKSVNDKGDKVECTANGVGPITGMAAQATHDSCVSKYKSEGYKEVS